MAKPSDPSRSYIVQATPSVRNVTHSGVGDPNDLMVTYRYQNRTDRLVTVSRRDGTRFTIKRTERATPNDEFSILVTYFGPVDVIIECLNLLDESREDSPDTRKIMRAFHRASDRRKGRTVTATVEYVINEKQLDDAGGRVYLTDLDLMLEWKGHGKAVNHPFSYAEREKKTLETMLPSYSTSTFALMFKAVDNTGKDFYSHRYINVGGEVFQIPVERDEAYVTGIHVTTRRAVTDRGVQDEDGLDTKYYSYEDADKKFFLHRTVEDAKYGGPIEEASKALLNASAARMKLEEQSLKTWQTGQEREITIMKVQSQRQKAEQEKEAAAQRNFMEWAKVGTSILGAAVSLLTIWQKISIK